MMLSVGLSSCCGAVLSAGVICVGCEQEATTVVSVRRHDPYSFGCFLPPLLDPYYFVPDAPLFAGLGHCPWPWDLVPPAPEPPQEEAPQEEALPQEPSASQPTTFSAFDNQRHDVSVEVSPDLVYQENGAESQPAAPAEQRTPPLMRTLPSRGLEESTLDDSPATSAHHSDNDQADDEHLLAAPPAPPTTPLVKPRFERSPGMRPKSSYKVPPSSSSFSSTPSFGRRRSVVGGSSFSPVALVLVSVHARMPTNLFLADFMPQDRSHVIVQGDRGVDLGCVVCTVPLCSDGHGGYMVTFGPMQPESTVQIILARLRRQVVNPLAAADMILSNLQGNGSLVRVPLTDRDVTSLHCVIEEATEADIARRHRGEVREREENCMQFLRELNRNNAGDLPPACLQVMHVLDCHCQFDLEKLTVFYESHTCVDFTHLAAILFKRYSCRIWMHQVNRNGVLNRMQQLHEQQQHPPQPDQQPPPPPPSRQQHHPRAGARAESTLPSAPPSFAATVGNRLHVAAAGQPVRVSQPQRRWNHRPSPAASSHPAASQHFSPFARDFFLQRGNEAVTSHPQTSQVVPAVHPVVPGVVYANGRRYVVQRG